MMWPEDRSQGWDATDELREYGVESLQAIIDAAEPFAEDAISKTPKAESGRQSQAIILVKLAEQSTELFHDDTGTPYVRLHVEDHQQTLRLDSLNFRRWLSRRFFEETDKAAGGEAIAAALSILEGKAIFEGKQHTLHVRVARHGGDLYYDLTDPLWRAVHVTSDGWSIVPNPPTLFKRFNHQASQVDPIPGGNIRRLFDFISVRDEEGRLLLLVWLVAAFIPGFPHPMPILHGPQGSGKSSTFRILRRLIDPSVLETLTFPRDLNELIQNLSHHWAPLFDNVTALPSWLSDALCRAVTGEGFSKRVLYSNDDDQIYHFQRCLGLNGINIVATRADLIDRSILVGLERISPEQRRTEEELETAFNEARPEILGGIFDTLVQALRIQPTVKPERLSRMADFTRWGCAIARALGYDDVAFFNAYEGNRQAQNEEVIEGHPVATAIVALMADRVEWKGEPSELLTNLEEIAEREQINTRDKSWPGAAHVLTRRIREVLPNLQEAGIAIEFSHSGRRRLHLVKSFDSSVHSVQASIDKQKQGLSPNTPWTLPGPTQNGVHAASTSKGIDSKDLNATDAMDATVQPQTGMTNLRDLKI